MNADAPEAKSGWLDRLGSGLSRTSSRLAQGITDIFTRHRLDDETLEKLDDLLIAADLGPATAHELTVRLARDRFDQDIAPDEVRAALAGDIAEILAPVAVPLILDPVAKPHVILVVGVNGSGKTTTIGKLAHQFKRQGKSVMLAAADTFRAAAINQLRIWGERAGAEVHARDDARDAAALAFDAFKRAQADGTDVLLVDTAGRLQNKADLMAELEKIIRVLKKIDAAAPQSCLLVLDATTGQNAHAQVEIFRDMTDVTGLIVTKLDGTAKGGVLVALAKRFNIPVHAIGVGEGIDDLSPFEAGDFARALLGLAR